MVGAIGLLGLTLLAEPNVACGGLDGEGRVLHVTALLGGQVAVAIVEVERRARIGEDGGRVAPVEHAIEEDSEQGG